MPLGESFSTDHVREYRTLSHALSRRSRIILSAVEGLTVDAALTEDREQLLVQILESGGIEGSGPELALLVSFSIDPVQQDEGLSATLRDPNPKKNVHHQCWVFQLPISYSGPEDLFGCWPDETDSGLEVFEANKGIGIPPHVVWEFGEVGRLFAWAYVPPDADGARPDHPSELFQRLKQFLRDYCACVNEQLSKWAEDMSGEAAQRLDERMRRARRARESRVRVNELLETGQTPPLTFELPVVGGDLPPSPQGKREEIQLPARLSERSFEDLVAVTQLWTRAVEKYPTAFVGLEEERLADLLVATLNGAFRRAEREVFVRRGKTDVYVPAGSVGDEDLGDSLIGELKIWDGRAVFLKAIGQALDNVTRHSLSALLVVLVKKGSFSAARSSALSVLTSLAKDDLQETAGCPVVPLQSAIDDDPSQTVRLAAVFVDLTVPAEKQVGKKGRR